MLSKATLLTLLPFFLSVHAGASGSGTTTRYWDCCKASCGWPGKATLTKGPVTSCNAQDQPLSDASTPSGCDNGGAAYMCSSQTPWAVSDSMSYGFAATTIAGGTEASWCCACYQLTFTSGPVAGKQMIVQTTNTGGDLSSNQFDIAVRLSRCSNIASSSFNFSCLQIFILSINPTNITADARRRIRPFRRMRSRMGYASEWLGRPIWWPIHKVSMRRLPCCPQSRLLLAL